MPDPDDPFRRPDELGDPGRPGVPGGFDGPASPGEPLDPTVAQPGAPTPPSGTPLTGSTGATGARGSTGGGSASPGSRPPGADPARAEILPGGLVAPPPDDEAPDWQRPAIIAMGALVLLGLVLIGVLVFGGDDDEVDVLTDGALTEPLETVPPAPTPLPAPPVATLPAAPTTSPATTAATTQAPAPAPTTTPPPAASVTSSPPASAPPPAPELPPASEIPPTPVIATLDDAGPALPGRGPHRAHWYVADGVWVAVLGGWDAAADEGWCLVTARRAADSDTLDDALGAPTSDGACDGLDAEGVDDPGRGEGLRRCGELAYVVTDIDGGAGAGQLVVRAVPAGAGVLAAGVEGVVGAADDAPGFELERSRYSVPSGVSASGATEVACGE